MDLTIVQRHAKAIPGSDGRIFIRIGDITEGQVLLSIVTEDGEALADSVPVSQGDSVRFELNDQSYVVRIRELRNLLTGQDFARVTVERATPEEGALEGDRDEDSER